MVVKGVGESWEGENEVCIVYWRAEQSLRLRLSVFGRIDNLGIKVALS